MGRWWRLMQQLQARARDWSARGRLLIIPGVLGLLVAHLSGITAYLLLIDQVVITEPVPWSSILFRTGLGFGTPLALVLVWRYSRPSRRIIWVYDWLGGGVICFTPVWLGMLGHEILTLELMPDLAHTLLEIGAVAWGAAGTGLLLAGTAYLSAELRNERQERERLEALMEFTARITSLDFSQTLHETVRHLHRLLHADAVVLFIWSEAEQVLIAEAGYHDPRLYTEEYVSKMMSFKCPMGFGLTGWAMKTGQPSVSGDVVRDPRSQAVPGFRTGEKSSLLAPIQVDGRRLGVVRLTRTGLNQFTGDDLDYVMSFAGQAALVLEHARIMKELSDLSITDGLTGLYNGRHFHQILDVEIHRAERYHQPLTLVMIDSDSLKRVNDKLGHLTGDEHLRAIGRALRAAVRLTDYAFRYAGDEFMLILPNTTPAEALVVAERVRRSMEAEEIGEGMRGTVSVGVAGYPVHAATAKDLLFAADSAMYDSKRAGKNRVTLAPPAWVDSRPS